MPNTSMVTTVILIRHGERNDPTPAQPDPHLSTAGLKRAQGLVHVVGQAGIKAIYTSHFTRTKEMARPLATHLGLSTTEMDEAADIKTSIVSHHAGKTVLVIGHSDTVPALINLLGGGTGFLIGDSEFDNLFVVSVFGANKASVTRLRYGN